MKLGKRCWFALGAVAVATLVACGGGGGGGGGASPPVASLSSSGPTILRDAEIVIRFSESMKPATLELTGALMAEAAGTWSRTEADNDTYTLRPADGSWSLGTWLDLMIVKASDSAGEALAAPVAAKFLVPLEFENGENASVVIGQADFAGELENQGTATPNSNTLAYPSGAVAVAPDGKLFVPDEGNARVLVFDSVPSASNSSAAYALGVPNLTSRGALTPAQDSVGGAAAVSVAGGKMAVTDYANNRVLIYDTIPGSAAALPTVVVGQAAFDQGASGCTASSLTSPTAVVLTPAGKLIVVDSNNNRVLVWNTVPTEHGKAADLVLGQVGFTSCGSGGPTAQTMNDPSGVWSDDTKLVVSDANNSRVLIWNTFPISSNQPADVVLGQFDFVHGTANDDDHDGVQDAKPTGRTLNSPKALASNGVQLAVADGTNGRVLIWNTFPTANFQPADVVLGQSNFDSDAYLGTTQSSFTLPTGLHFAGDKLFVVDINSSRVLVFKSR